MTTTPTHPVASRVARRRQLITLIGRATQELAELERADARTATQAAALRPHVPPETAPSTMPDGIIRAWARTNDIPVNRAGRVNRDVRIAFAQAHPNQP